jgi:hypothetical protein
MKCRLLQRHRTHLRASTPGAAIAAQLRAQIPCSTDPNRLERLACEAEGRSHTRNFETDNRFFCAAFADWRHGATRDKGHSAAT